MSHEARWAIRFGESSPTSRLEVLAAVDGRLGVVKLDPRGHPPGVLLYGSSEMAALAINGFGLSGGAIPFEIEADTAEKLE